MKPLRRLSGLVLVLGMASASPATDLYSAATSAVKRDYFGWATADFSALAREYEAVLAERCAPQGETCDYGTGRAVLTELFKAFGDAHTNVRDPEGAQRLNEVTQDRAVPRTGVRVVRVEGGLLVASVMPGSPAHAAGLRRLDLLPMVNGEAAGKRNSENAPVGPVEFVRLERAGQPIRVTLRRAGEPERELLLSSDVLKARDVATLSWVGSDGKTALIDLPTFLSSDASELFLAKVREAQAAGARRLIVDLRFNSGGSLTQCVAAASTFEPVRYKSQFQVGSYTYIGVNGKSVSALGRVFTPADARIWKGPVAVLVGPNTASCAEVFSFFAQKAGAVTVGELTRGVGNSGVLFSPLPDGGVLSVTVLKAFTADGQPLPERVIPLVVAPTDVALLSAEGRDSTLEAALSALDRQEAATR
ncbi:S41 family peptidase [Deinococcus deserti]|uniref:Putative Peptidase S41 putative C-terminal processing peptidase n=1 Tax=Deinococcus deserti (strain DSM 17065 / CIP 109153 / LMG 22923 / VCD115) TaxID=546414 RepID=C1CVI2_DEIDV|nr:S41 family peptidase [Deinococcus deserti]ACO46199.1 putative Peptidase S41 precursor; putative C-terminal processing peptidase [Deinococcus deserti VCD115]